ncbi:MAG TPA: PP2C family protein-serine/threonine phosphatase [Acidimicrobiales bacterium]|nr:PP2C family protein-serine/threonine phosphatase [Acidimicrobiales bacterium]
MPAEYDWLEEDVEDHGFMASATRPGPYHRRNEDVALLSATASGWPVLIVCDGVGSNPLAAEAARDAADAVADHLAEIGQPRLSDLAAAVLSGHRAANETGGERQPAGETTIALAVVSPGAVLVGNVGDSRIYAGTGAWMQQVSVDHATGPYTLTQCLGGGAPDPVPHLRKVELPDGGFVLVCSDGLSNCLWGGEREPRLRASSPAEICAALIRRADERGATDDATLAVGTVPARPSPRVP